MSSTVSTIKLNNNCSLRELQLVFKQCLIRYNVTKNGCSADIVIHANKQNMYHQLQVFTVQTFAEHSLT